MIEIIPAIDVIGGKCVRLTQGDYTQKKVYNENPLEVAKMFEDAGIRRLHLVDLDGAKAQHIVNHRILAEITSKTKLVVDFGGGLKTDKDLQIAFESGAAMITGGSIAVKNPETFEHWISEFGAEKIILGADVKEEKITVTGWTEDTDLKIIPFIQKYVDKGLNKVICTDVSKDGMLEGPSLELCEKLIRNFPDLYLIASGGVSCVKDIDNLIAVNVPAIIFGKAFYEGNIKLNELKKYL